jgi:hypothetical protein
LKIVCAKSRDGPKLGGYSKSVVYQGGILGTCFGIHLHLEVNDDMSNWFFNQITHCCKSIGDFQPAHTEPLFKKLKILPLNELITFFKLVFMFDFAHENLPLSFKNMWRTNSDLRNSENPMALRNDHDYYIPFIRLDSFVKFPLSEYPRLWNEFESNEIKSIDSRNLFKKLLKEHFFDKLADSITCDRLLCPSCHLNQ